jgi:hypothetical protein
MNTLVVFPKNPEVRGAVRPGFLVRVLARQRHGAYDDYGMMIAIKKAAAGVPTTAPSLGRKRPRRRATTLTQPTLDSDHCSGSLHGRESYLFRRRNFQDIGPIAGASHYNGDDQFCDPDSPPWSGSPRPPGDTYESGASVRNGVTVAYRFLG